MRNAGLDEVQAGIKIAGEIPVTTDISILAWEISWKKEPNGLQFMGSQESDTTMTKQQQQSTGSRKPLQQIIIVRGGTKGMAFLE